MVEGYVGAARYRDGINAYLKKFAFANATGEGFWTTLAAVTKQAGRSRAGELHHAEQHAARESRNAMRRRQHRARVVAASHLGRGAGVDVVGHSGLLQARAQWKSAASRVRAPVCQHADGEARWLLVLGLRERRQPRLLPRVVRKPDDLRALGEAARNGQLTPLEQTTLLEDLWALVPLDEQSIAEYLSLSSQLVKSQLSPAIATALSRINYISDWLVEEPQRPAFQRWVRQTVRPLAGASRLDAESGRTRRHPEPPLGRDLHDGKRRARSRRAARGAAPRATFTSTGAAPLHASLVDTTLAARGDRWRRRRSTSSTCRE